MQTEFHFNDVRNMTPIDTLIHMGAGRCSELDKYLTLKPRQLLLFEADSQLAQDLRNRTTGLEYVQVSCIAIAGNPGSATLHRYNLPEVNSLHPASGLIDLFPGLKLVEKQQVKTVSPVTLLQPLQLDTDKENRLVVDLPGEELPVLKALQHSHQLELFSRIYLCCGLEPLYEGSEPVSRILDWLQEVGFDMLAEDDSRDPDRPCWSFRRNALQSRNRDLQQQLDQVLVKNEQLTKYVAGLQADAQKLTLDRDIQSKLAGEREAKVNELTKQANERKSQLDQLAKVQEEQTKLVADLNLQLEQVNQSRTKAEKLAAERETKIEATIKARDEQTKITAERQEKITQLINSENKQKTLIENQKAEIDKLKTSLHEANNRSAQLEAQLSKMEQRQQLLNEELIKTEGQIDLIKDLLLREPGI